MSFIPKDELKKACFGEKVSKDWREKHASFMMAWFDLHIERTPKLHIIEVCRSSTHTHPESNLDKLLDPKNSENRFWELSNCRI